MEGQYNLWIVGLSYIIAVLASYTVLEMSGKVMQPESRTAPWLAAGSIAMGTGIWSMHFVGMEAFSLPIEIIYDIPLTAFSWVAAVAVSALALWTLSKLADRPGNLDSRLVVIAGILMGLGICAMHYSGMFALRLSPGISYDPLLFSASFLIAAGAAIVTLLIAVKLREVTRFTHLLMRGGAALIMGVAITGMHYTGMAAASIAPDAVCLTGIGLEAGWTIGPVTAITLIILAVAVALSIRDTRAIRRRTLRREHRRLNREAEIRAFTDPETNLPNRSWLTRRLTHVDSIVDRRLSLLVIESRGRLNAETKRDFAQWLQKMFPHGEAACLRSGRFALLFEDQEPTQVHQQVSSELMTSRFSHRHTWQIGMATWPDDTENPFQLMRRATSTEALLDELPAGQPAGA